MPSDPLDEQGKGGAASCYRGVRPHLRWVLSVSDPRLGARLPAFLAETSGPDEITCERRRDPLPGPLAEIIVDRAENISQSDDGVGSQKMILLVNDQFPR